MKRNNTEDNKQFTEFLSPINFLLKLSGKAYEKYMVNKIYLHALNIRKANEKVYQLVLDQINHIPVNLQQDCIELLNHYDCWMLQFKHEEEKRKPALGDEFIFLQLDGQMAYPRLGEQRIFDAYLKFNKQKNK